MIVHFRDIFYCCTAAARPRDAAATLRQASPGSGPAARLARRALPDAGVQKSVVPATLQRAEYCFAAQVSQKKTHLRRSFVSITFYIERSGTKTNICIPETMLT